ncbi:PIKK family atypical protein kinase [Trichomonas vaginalis G3]|uniref:Serine/threonine-protein kinase TOR n=1 Tax=Trichomonas vaginalis (strain ATCC PRA-98 / G3) TaxID=412133 RepID=A2G2C3_TRIV3|nr:ataxia telangiectasia mutated (ATM) -related family [Trichomonas vaginalis G3]EAX88702.1 PIKK family atypical protein kinase [Trichomonas vaginalis G3]KAI5519894.1 ataxia telangiectasia mutated (ATM) -related family [Trichomonas vaginalis G3]|eukprot:XP_001301632.1 PIKK family atypical protein kinase [Trichomonas vaginalis G3]
MTNVNAQNIFEILDKVNYKDWKRKRQKTISIFGKSLLALSDNEISNTFNLLEEKIKSIGNQSEIDLSRCLLTISVIHYFRRSIEHLNLYFPTVIKWANTKNINIAQMFAKFFYYIIIDTENFQQFLSQILSLVNDMLSPENKDMYYINAFLILYQLAKIDSINILNVTIKHMQDITTAVCSNNKVLRLVGEKLFKIHLRMLPDEISSRFATDKFNLCIQMLKQWKNRQSIVPVLLGHALFKSVPSPLSADSVFEVLYDILPNINFETQIYWYKFIKTIAKAKYNQFSPEITKFILDNLKNSMENIQFMHIYLKVLRVLVHKLSESVLIYNKIVDILISVLQNQELRVEYYLVYDIAEKLLVKFPNHELDYIFFINPQPTTQFINLLKLQPKVFTSMTDILRSWIILGMSTENSSEDSTILAIHILLNFGIALFPNIQGVLDQIMLIGRSLNDKVRMQAINAIYLLDPKHSSRFILQFALYDPSKDIRLQAVRYLKPEDFDDVNQIICLLSDRSLNVCVESLPLISSVYNNNPILFESEIFNFINNYITTYMPLLDFQKLAKACKQLPHLVSNFKSICSPIAPKIIWLCTSILLGNTKIADFTQIEHDLDTKLFNPDDLNKYQIPDASFCTDILDKGTYWHQAFIITHGKRIDSRNTSLFDTLSVLSDFAVPFILQIYPIFQKYFNSSHSPSLYISALKCLKSMTISMECKFKFTTLFPDLLPSLLNLIASSNNDEVATLILKVIGTIGTPDTIPMQNFLGKQQPSSQLHMTHPSFFADFTLNSLVSLLSKSQSLSVFQAITSILANSTNYLMKYLETILSEFRSALEADLDSHNLFQQLEIVVYSCGWNTAPYIDQFIEICKKHLLEIDCLNLCITISFQLRSGSVNFCSSLFPSVLAQLNNQNIEIIKKLLKFATFCTLFQRQSIQALVSSITKNFFSQTNPSTKQRTKPAIKYLTMIIQHYTMHNCGVQIANIAFRQLKHSQAQEVLQLILNLCLFADLDIEYVEKEALNCGVTIPHLIDVKKLVELSHPIIEQVLFVQNFEPHIKVSRIKSNIITSPDIKVNIFENLKTPYYNQMEKWLNEMEYPAITNSPNVSIRTCSFLLNQYKDFQHDLFPVAFLTCWINEPLESRKKFSEIIEQSLIKFDSSNIGKTLSQLVTVLDRYGMPFLIPDSILSTASNSAALSLYQIERSLISNRKQATMTNIERLLSFNTRIGRIETARSLLNKHQINESGKWLEKLGEWEKALNVHLKSNTPKTDSLVRCYANLEQWEKVRQLNISFEKMTREEKVARSKWFAYAYLHSKDIEISKKYIEYVDKNDDILSIIILSLFYISCEDYKTAEMTIERGFRTLIKDKSIYNGTDINMAHKYLIASQHFVELYECILFKEKKSQKVPKIWSNRLENYTEDSDAWKKLIDIRLLVLRPEDNVESCRKMISVLRKERKWRMIDSYLRRLESVYNFPIIILERIKINWLKGEKTKSLKQIDHFSKILSLKSQEEFLQSINEELDDENLQIQFLLNFSNQKTSQNLQNYQTLQTLQNNLQNLPKNLQTLQNFSIQNYQNFLKNWDIDDIFRCKVLRLSANWRYNLYKSNSNEINLKEVIDLFEKCVSLNEKDYLSWAGLAYSCSRFLSHETNEIRQNYAIIAIKGFLKASKLNPSSSLQYLCQVFSIFVQYFESFPLPDEIKNELLSLDSSMVFKIIPQIIVHVTNSSTIVRSIVEEIITKFSQNNFEAVVYPLSVISKDKSNEKSLIASEVMTKLSFPHSLQYKDFSLFIDGMIKSAVCWCERWINSLNSLSSIKNIDEILKNIGNMFNESNDELCEFDKSLKNFHKKLIERSQLFYQQLMKGDKSYMNPLWEMLQNLMKDIQMKMNEIDAIYLSKISEELAEKFNFLISVPGTYKIQKNLLYLYHIEERLELFNTLTHPRLLIVVDNQGNRHKFLLKGNEDLRLDQRIMQLFSLVNSLIKTNRSTRAHNVNISMYDVVPFAPNTGLISWVNGADTVLQIVNDFRTLKNRQNSIEKTVFHEYTSLRNNTLNGLQLLEIHDEICRKTNADELRESFWVWSDFPSTWVQITRNFTLSTALMSVEGYIIGLGDRHLRNIMVQQHTGTVIHIDFGECFESASNRILFPEKVPFRMTRLFQNALEGGNVDGIFRIACEDYMYLMRENVSPVIAMLEVFVHEPIFSSKSQFKNHHSILTRVSQKILGTDSEYGGDETKEMEVPQHVANLIKAATDRSRYCRHYQGWQPYL